MGSHASRRGSGGSVAVTTLLLALQLLLLLLLLPAPVSSQAGLVVKAFPFIKKLGNDAIKAVVNAGGPALIKHSLSSSTNDDAGGHAELLGAAAADNAGVIIYDVSIGSAQQNFSGVVDLFSNFVWVQSPESPAAAFSAVPCDSQTCARTLNVTDDAGDCSGDCEYYFGGADYGTNTTGYLAQETMTAGAASGTVVFGCSSVLPPIPDPGNIASARAPTPSFHSSASQGSPTS